MLFIFALVLGLFPLLLLFAFVLPFLSSFAFVPLSFFLCVYSFAIVLAFAS
jgi:hypothetical protein